MTLEMFTSVYGIIGYFFVGFVYAVYYFHITNDYVTDGGDLIVFIIVWVSWPIVILFREMSAVLISIINWFL